MPIEIDASLPSEVIPLSWLIGSWEGVGVVGYHDSAERQFGQRASFSVPVGAPYLEYRSHSWLLDEDGNEQGTLQVETGIWQLVRQREAFDTGPGMILPEGETTYTTAESVESLRNSRGGFDLEVGIVQPHGIVELYTGQVDGPRIDLATDVVARTKTAKDYSASSRMYGLVDGDLLWAWDISALGKSMASHASARLKKVS